MAFDFERRPAEVDATIDENLVCGIEARAAAAVVHVEEIEFVEQLHHGRKRKAPKVRWKTMKGLHPGHSDVAKALWPEQPLDIARCQPWFAYMFQDMLADDEPESSPLDRGVKIGKVRTNVGDPIDVRASFDIEADEF